MFFNHLQMERYTSFLSSMILVKAYFDTGATSSILKPDILSSSFSNSCLVPFKEANGQIFTVSLISKPINIQLFHGYMVKTKVYGSELHKKDFILGFDVLHTLKRVSWHRKGLKHKKHLLTWTTISHLYPHGDFESYPDRNFQDIMCCFSLKFLMGCPSPLLNQTSSYLCASRRMKTSNPTKASHPCMNPYH